MSLEPQVSEWVTDICTSRDAHLKRLHLKKIIHLHWKLLGVSRHSKCHEHPELRSCKFLHFSGKFFWCWHFWINSVGKLYRGVNLERKKVHLSDILWQMGSRPVCFWKKVLEACTYKLFHAFFGGTVFGLKLCLHKFCNIYIVSVSTFLGYCSAIIGCNHPGPPAHWPIM